MTGADAGLKIGFFALLLRPGPERAGAGLRPRRRRQRGDGAGRGQGLPEGVPQEPHRRRRRVPRQGRAADPRQHADAEGERSVQPARVVPDHQPRAAQAERQDDRRAGREERARSPVAGAVQAADRTRRSNRASPTSAPTSTRAATSTSRCTSASTWRRRRAAPVQASNAGRIVLADFLGIYGNCVIVDHGLGLQSLYAHLSSIGVKVGDTVTQGQELGRSGTTGLAGGDHLHFTMLLGGHAVTPVDWWSAAVGAGSRAAQAARGERRRRPPPPPTAATGAAGRYAGAAVARQRIESAHVRRGRPRDIPRDGHRRPLAHVRLRRPHQAAAEPAGRRDDGRRLLPGRRAGRRHAAALVQRHARHGARRRRIGGVQPGDGAPRRRADGAHAPPARRRGAPGAARVAAVRRGAVARRPAVAGADHDAAGVRRRAA